MLDLATMSTEVIVKAAIAYCLDTGNERIKDDSRPSDFIEWDSLANMAIYAEILDRLGVEIDYYEYIKCANIGELCRIAEHSKAGSTS